MTKKTIPLELLTPSQMALADKFTIEHDLSGELLMENAGRACFDEIVKRYKKAHKILILSGPGNNGGDGFVIARLLEGAGYLVKLALLGSKDNLKGDAKLMAMKYEGEVIAVNNNIKLEEFDLIIDALFGTGLSKNIGVDLVNLFDRINDIDELKVLAVDIASGVDGLTGKIKGAALKADLTITFCRAQPGHYLLEGKSYMPEIKIVEIGISDENVKKTKPAILLNHKNLWINKFPNFHQADHKYIKGHMFVLGGKKYCTGASRLSARAGLRVGAGLSTIIADSDTIDEIAYQQTSVMNIKYNDLDEFTKLISEPRIKAFLLGPGAGVNTSTIKKVLEALKNDYPVILDADAITSFMKEPDLLFSTIKKRITPTILTPHHGEFAIFNLSGEKDAKHTSKIDKALEAAKLSGAYIVYKGSDTVIASPEGKEYSAINYNAPPFLATAGSGDVLAGMITGLLAQNMPAFEAACTAVWLHGESANYLGAGLISEDLCEVIPEVIQNI